MRTKRPIVNPNMSFIAQLVNFHKRLYADFNSVITNPRVFAVCSLQPEQPKVIVCKLIMENLYQRPSFKALDPRGVFIIQTETSTTIWLGSQMSPLTLSAYTSAAHEYCSTLCQEEKALPSPSVVTCGQEPSSFWSLFSLSTAPATLTGKMQELNPFFVDVSDSDSSSRLQRRKCRKCPRWP